MSVTCRWRVAIVKAVRAPHTPIQSMSSRRTSLPTCQLYVSYNGVAHHMCGWQIAPVLEHVHLALLPDPIRLTPRPVSPVSRQPRPASTRSCPPHPASTPSRRPPGLFALPACRRRPPEKAPGARGRRRRRRRAGHYRRACLERLVFPALALHIVTTEHRKRDSYSLRSRYISLLIVTAATAEVLALSF